jgi:hypothetical protein
VAQLFPDDAEDISPDLQAFSKDLTLDDVRSPDTDLRRLRFSRQGGPPGGLSPRQSHQGPVTGELLDQAEDRIGDVVITQVRERIATGAYSGSVQPVIGDAARTN